MMERRSNMKLGSRLLVLLFLMGAGLIVASLIFALTDAMSIKMMITAQDVLAFIVPAVAAMYIFYRRPWHAMGMDRAPSWTALLLVVAFAVLSMPAMNWLVHFNEAMKLPPSMSGIEQWMRASEDAAADITDELLDIHTIGELIVCLFVVGFMAGLSEEMLFRGAMLRTMQDSRMGTHAVVWIVAIIFSAFHMEFYGFIPRVVLGLWLGYLLVWTRSLWVPIIAHTLNNSTVVLFSFLAGKGIVPKDFGDSLGIPADGCFPWLAVASAVASIFLVVWASRYYSSTKKDAHISNDNQQVTT